MRATPFKKACGFLEICVGACLSALWVVPLAWAVTQAFVPAGVSAGGWSRILAFPTFKAVLEAAPFGRYFVNSLTIVAVILVGQILTVTLAAYAFARLNFWGRDAVFLILLLQIVIPNDVLIVPNYQTIAALKSVNTLRGIMFPFFGSAFGIFLLRQTFKSIPLDFDHAAELDGTGLFRKLIHVYAPMSTPAYVAFAMVSASAHWNDFLWPLIVTSSNAVRPMTVGLALFATSYETGAQWPEVSAATLLVSGPLFLLFALFQRQFVESFAYSSGLK